jgi:hypothetical protein
MATGMNAVDSAPMQPYKPKNVEDKNSEVAGDKKTPIHPLAPSTGWILA